MTNTNTNSPVHAYIKAVLANMPQDWLKLTTHRLDVYNESLAKSEFLNAFEACYTQEKSDSTTLSELPTAYDYIRLGHPLSSVMEWMLAKLNGLGPEQVISFSSSTIPVMAVLRKNLLENRTTQIVYRGELPAAFDSDLLQKIYGYNFCLKQVDPRAAIPAPEQADACTVLIQESQDIHGFDLLESIDFLINIHPSLGSILYVNGAKNLTAISAIQHVRRRETIAMTPSNCLIALQRICGIQESSNDSQAYEGNMKKVLGTIKDITHSDSKALVASSGLSMQYAIMMGLIHNARENHAGKAIRIIVPPNCYGGTNDQARRVAACLDNVEVMDLLVDGDNDMVLSTDFVLDEAAKQDAVPLLIAEIPTNPRVEVPNLTKLSEVLQKKRHTPNGDEAIAPVFILDQTFCPNVNFLGHDRALAPVQVIAYVSGSKFPSGGKCTAGYCVANKKADALMEKIDLHLHLCDNQATEQQMDFLAEQLPSMLQRIEDAYVNTREFVNFIKEVLPTAKINFVSEELAAQGFTPSVFSLDLPTKGSTDEERENYKRALNLKLINKMISEIPNESKYCVSYGQLKGCYWTIPATSTQGTTKEGDKDYIARVALSGNMDLNKHKEVFLDFVKEI